MENNDKIVVVMAQYHALKWIIEGMGENLKRDFMLYII